ncbi:hypothetical protein SEA_LADYBIRD_90 [Mycobacterium phage LadyBird]|uniref:hypothetical protein n=1 Tax=Mycobacterium phage LadyBird TaxID=1718166 RepID=UPI0006CE46BF|nr:hypothetical protein SEA_LADYBIRD_90 [Mycobacterium phage LadyBird]ALF02231.1 hypothetical protein SEA_LADYBIRD_90 [Mycobacterium phage LadyBird]
MEGIRVKARTKDNLITITIAFVTAVTAMAIAEPPEASAEPTVNLTELRTVDGRDYPVCHVEDCSDQPGQVGIWEDKDTGNWWLSLGEQSYLVIDDTAIDID